MNREELKEYMPHREPMLLLDEVDILDDGSVRARYRVPEDAFFLQGHFPSNPIVPGVILCEIMAQSCSFLAKDLLKGKPPFLVALIRCVSSRLYTQARCVK